MSAAPRVRRLRQSGSGMMGGRAIPGDGEPAEYPPVAPVVVPPRSFEERFNYRGALLGDNDALFAWRDQVMALLPEHVARDSYGANAWWSTPLGVWHLSIERLPSANLRRDGETSMQFWLFDDLSVDHIRSVLQVLGAIEL